MEELSEGVNNMNISGGDLQKKNRIQVSNTKKPLFFYVNLAKVKLIPFVWSFCFVPYVRQCLVSNSCFGQRYMQQYNDVELSALGMGTFPNFLRCFFLFLNLICWLSLILFMYNDNLFFCAIKHTLCFVQFKI